MSNGVLERYVEQTFISAPVASLDQWRDFYLREGGMHTGTCHIQVDQGSSWCEHTTFATLILAQHVNPRWVFTFKAMDPEKWYGAGPVWR